jgi:hypothetical protein
MSGNVQERYPAQLPYVQYAMQQFGHCLAILNKIDVLKLFFVETAINTEVKAKTRDEIRGGDDGKCDV